MPAPIDEIGGAQGGLERWRDATAIEADGLNGGALWEFMGWSPPT
jgi:hypothetical protein